MYAFLNSETTLLYDAQMVDTNGALKTSIKHTPNY